MIWVLSTPWIFCLNKLVLFEQHVATVSIQCRNKKQNWLNAIPNIVASKINKEWPGPSASLICFLVWWFAEQRNHQLPLCFPASSFPFWGKLIDMPTTGMVAGCWHSLLFVQFATTLPGGSFADSFLGQELFLMHWCQHWWHQEEEFVFVCCMFVCCRTSHSTQRADKGEREEDDTTTLPGAIFLVAKSCFWCANADADDIEKMSLSLFVACLFVAGLLTQCRGPTREREKKMISLKLHTWTLTEKL